MTWLQAVLLGVVQGLTEFLPVSSSGHLALGQHVLRRLGSSLPPSESPGMLLFDLCTHLGTLAAIAVVFLPVFRRYVRSLVHDLPRYRLLASDKPPAALYVTLLGVVACVPTAVIGLTFEDRMKAAFGQPATIGVALLITGCLLWASELGGRPRRGWRKLGLGAALLIGVAQGLAITPGISRSGSTVSVALLCGLRRRWAGQFSFLIFIPPVLAGSLKQAAEVLAQPQASDFRLGPTLVGTLVAALVGYAALKVFLAVIQKAKLRYFAFYCWLVGLAAIVATWYC